MAQACCSITIFYAQVPYDTLHTMTQTSYHIEEADTQHMTLQSSRKTSNYTHWHILLAHYYNHSCMWVSCHKHMQLLEITLVHYCREIIMSKYHAQKTEKLVHKITRRSLASRVCIIFARTRTKMRCVLAQIKINKVHEVLAQITRDKFFSIKGKGHKLGLGKHKP